jgi:arylsulfatase
MDIEGKKGEKARETIAPKTIEDYRKISAIHQEKALDFIKRKANDDKPFYMAYWPNVYDLIVKDMEITTSNSSPFAQNILQLDKYIGQILDELEAQGISENTLVICMADNGPMKEVAGAFYQNIFRGGKGDFWEGGIRVPAFAVWPGVIGEGQIVGDMITVHDLYTTFAKLGGGTKYIPTDRVIDGIDQTAMLLEGDGNSRRDYYHIYTGPLHAATIKQQFKRVWLGDHPGLVGAAFFDLYQDPREIHGIMASLTWLRGIFQDEYGIKPTDVNWVISNKDSSADAAGKISKQEQVNPKGVNIKMGTAGLDESELLLSGEVDALFHAAEPKAYIE